MSAAGSDALFADQIREMLKGSVIGSFGVLWEKAARQLPFLQVIGNAVAADSLAGAGFVGAAADFQVSFFFAVHNAQVLSFKYLSFRRKRFGQSFFNLNLKT